MSQFKLNDINKSFKKRVNTLYEKCIYVTDKSALVGVPNDLPARRLRMHHHFEETNLF